MSLLSLYVFQYYEENNSPEEVLDTLKQKLTALAQRLKRYTKGHKRKQENQMFQKREGLFDRNLQENMSAKTNGLPDLKHVEDYWSYGKMKLYTTAKLAGLTVQK